MKKKLLTLGLVASMSFTLVGCGDKKEAATTTTTATQAPKVTEAPAATEAADTTNDNTASDSSDDSSSSGQVTSMKDLEGILTTGYAATPEGDDDSAILLAMNDEGTFSVLVVIDAKSNKNVSFVGESTDNGDGTMTINDESSQLAVTFGVEDNGDGTFTFDYGDLGKAVAAHCEVSKVLEMMDTVNQNTSSVN